MTEPLVTIYERKFHIVVDPSKPGSDVTVWWYFDKDGKPQILKTEQPSNNLSHGPAGPKNGENEDV